MWRTFQNLPGLSQPFGALPSALTGDITPGQGSVQAAPEDSKVWSRVSWAGQEQLLSFSESPSLRTGSVPGMQ